MFNLEKKKGERGGREVERMKKCAKSGLLVPPG